MRKNKIISLILVIAMLLSFTGLFDIPAVAEAVSETDLEVIGYGYNVTGGKSLSKSSLLYRNPILDVKNPELLSKIMVSNYLENKSENLVAESAQEIATMMSSSYGGGINAKVNIVNVDISASFDRGQAMSNAVKERYEVYYQSIARRQIVLQMSVAELRDYLSKAFERDAAMIKTLDDAIAFLNTYGTHLFTGYTLGGRLEVTNYKVTNSASVDLNQTVDLKAQVGAAAAAASGGLSFSITEQYGSHENTSNQKSIYNFSSVGGEAVAALTIDHLFTYNASLVDGKGNYEYARWAYAINEGKNLDILGAATGTNAIPVWELLDYSAENSEIRMLLVNAYAQMCGDKYQEYKEMYPYLDGRFDADADGSMPIGEIVEYMSSLGNVVSGPFANEDGVVYDVVKGSRIYLASADTADFGKRNYSVYGGDNNATIVDEISGVVDVTGVIGNTFSIALNSGDYLMDVINFRIVEQQFSGGLGTEEQPYLISTVSELQKLLNTAELYSDSSKHYLLINDIIDASDLKITKPMTKNKAFAGVFDGGYYTISGYNSVDSDATDNNPYPVAAGSEAVIGLFGYNQGTIKNLKVDLAKITVTDTKKELPVDTYAGILVGINAGTIQNCVVSNSGLEVIKTFLSTDDANKVYRVYAGGLVGMNTGTIEKCGVKFVDVKAQVDIKLQKKLEGLAAAGGFAGYLYDTGVIKNSYTRIYDSKNSADKNNRIFAQVVGAGSDMSSCGHAYVGGFIGRTGTKTVNPKIDNCIVDVPSMLWAYIPGCTVSGVVPSDQEAGTFVGLNEGLENNVSCVSDCFVLRVSSREMYAPSGSSIATVKDGMGKNGITHADDTLSLRQSINFSALEDYISGDVWCSANDEEGSVALVDMSLSSITTATLKTEYSYGNTWTPIDINPTITMKNGKTVKPVAWRVDVSGFDAQKIGSNFPIKISTGGLSTSYNARVVKCDIEGIVAGDSSQENLYSETYYDYTTREFYVKALLSNGKYIDLRSETALDYVNYPLGVDIVITSEKLKIGNNEISVKYGDLNTTCIVYATENSVDEIEIARAPDTLVYRVGSNFSSEGMEVKVTYSNGMVEYLSGRDLSSLEIIGGTIAYGTNTIIVTYGDYKTQSIEVEGYSPLLVEKGPDKTKYYIGEEIDWTGCVIKYTTDGIDFVPVDLSDCSFSAASITAEGTNFVTVTYKSISATFEFTGVFKYIPNYSVTFVGFGGEILSSLTYDEGANVIAPTAPDVEGYVFKGWDTEVSSATKNVVYTAIYEKIVIIPEYMVVFVGHGGIVLRSNMYEEGTTISAPIVPTVAGYNFVGWDKEILPVTKNEIYTAVYDKIPETPEHTVIFVGFDGVVLRSNIYKEGATVTAPIVPTIEGYTFVGWDKEILPVTKSEIYTAVYEKIPEIPEYTVIFIGHGGVVLRSSIYEQGATVNPPAVPSVEGHNFIGWDKEITKATKNEVYTAVYDKIPETPEHTVIFVGHGGTVLRSNIYAKGTNITPPAAPAVSGYNFVGWDKEILPVTKNEVYTAIYEKIPEIPEYSVIFVGHNGSVLRSSMYAKGTTVTAPIAPTVKGYTFVGWDKEILPVTKNEIYTAVYEKIPETPEYVIIFIGFNGITLRSNLYKEGSVVTAPVAPAVNGYTFVGWDQEISAATGSAIYTAIYTQNPIVPEHLVIFVGFNGTTIYSGLYKDGSMVVAPTAPKVNGYNFIGWDKEISLATKNVVYTAVYEEVETMKDICAIADVNGDGAVDNKDVVLLLQHVHFNDIKIYATADVNGDGKVTTDDALYLKNYLSAPKDYPIGQ